MRILIIDSSRQFMADLRRLLAAGLPDVEVTEYDAEERGMPGGQFDWGLYDLLVMTLELGDRQEGLHWLERLGTLTGFPPVLMLADSIDVYTTVEVMRAGAADVLLRADLQRDALLARVERSARRHSVLIGVGSVDGEAVLTEAAARHSGRQPTRVVLGRDEYRFMRLIGQGGMSRVYLVRRSRDQRLMVMKTLDGERLADAATRKRFLAEAELARSVNHAHVVEVDDFGMSGAAGMIAMEFFPGGDLKRRIEGGVSDGQALDYLRQMALALDAIHAAGIVHRDLKPGNLMFRADGTLALADFGIAKRLDEGRLDTTFGRVLGTPAYFSPEQARGVKVDARSDIYSAGVIFYEMLTGVRPFDALSVESMIYHHVHAEVPPLPRHLRRYQPLVDGMLVKAPEQRFGGGQALLDVINRL